LLLFALLAVGTARAESERPNIILIITDDLNTQTLRDGSPVRVPTPHLDRLAAGGTRFMNAHAVSPICGPSRAGFLTGYHPQTSGYWGWKQQRFHWRDNDLLGRAPTFVELARDNGYRVAGGGKVFHNGHEDYDVFRQDGTLAYGPRPSHGPFAVSRPKGAEWRRAVPHPDFAEMKSYDAYCPLSNVPVTEGHAGWGIHNGGFRYEGPDDRDPMPDEALSAWAAQWLREYADDRPFLLVVGFNRPHGPFIVPDEYFERFPLESITPVPTPEGDVLDNAPELQPPDPDTWTSGGLRRYLQTLERDGDLRKWTQAYMACVSFIDDQLAVVLDALRDSPHAGNTLVIFTSDHGYHMGEKERLFKNTVWEASTAVPLIVSGPGIPAGGSVPHPVSLVDLYPTIADAAQLPPRADATLPPLDGRSLLPLARDPTRPAPGPPVALSTVPPDAAFPDAIGEAIPRQHWSVRSARFRYVLGNCGGEELYDHAADPWEWHNLAADPAYAAPKARLRAALDALLE